MAARQAPQLAWKRRKRMVRSNEMSSIRAGRACDAQSCFILLGPAERDVEAAVASAVVSNDQPKNEEQKRNWFSVVFLEGRTDEDFLIMQAVRGGEEQVRALSMEWERALREPPTHDALQELLMQLRIESTTGAPSV